MPGQPNLDERLQGYRTVLAEHPQIQIAQVVNVKGDPRIAFDAAAESLKAKSVPDAYVCLVSFACPEVADVLDRNKVTGKVVVAMDTDANTLNWIQKGLIAATIAQKPFTMAHFGVIMLDSLYHYKLPTLDAPWARDTRSPIRHRGSRRDVDRPAESGGFPEGARRPPSSRRTAGSALHFPFRVNHCVSGKL